MINNPDSIAESIQTNDLFHTKEENIRQRAYDLYRARGQEEGHDIEDWLQAEAEIETGEMPGGETEISSSAR